jgi:N-acetylmuramoyl-L-alanine amidase
MKLIATFAISGTLLTVLGAAQSSRSANHSVTAVRHWSQSDTTRIAVEVSGSFEYRTERLHNPERVYFDILNARPRIDSRRIYSEEIGDKLVSKIRVAETLPGVTRIVLDLNGAVEATPSQLSNPNRLIIELRMGTAPAIPSSPAPSTLPTITMPAPEPVAPPVNLPLKAPARTDTAVPVPVTTRAESPKPETFRSDPLPGETAKAAHRTSTGNTSLIRALGLKVGRVVIDPGHGGHDQGTEGSKGLLEKDLVLDIAKRVGALIEDRLGAEVIYTRSDDTFIPLEARTALANDNKADLFLSIHANSSPVARIAGVETYYRSFTNAKDSLEVAARENASSQKSIAELEDLIHTMMLSEKVEESKDFAARIQASLFSFSTRNFPGVRDRGVKKAPFVVLNGAKAPSVLVEIGFLSNSREEALLHKPEYRQKLAEALFRGVSKYAESLSHFQVAKAANEE